MTCEDDYSLFNEEKESFSPGWINETTRTNYSLSIINSFKYTNGNDLNNAGYVYDFRGRLSEIRGNICELRQLNWIDEKSRLIIIEMSLYNPNIEMFTCVTFVIEFLSSGGISSSSRFEPFNIQSLFLFNLKKKVKI
jgi:polycystin 1L2